MTAVIGRLTDALADSEARTRAMLDSMLEGCQLIGFDWRYLYVNEAVAAQGRRPKHELVGRTMMEAYPGIERTPLFDVLRECMAQRTTRCLENEFSHVDGSTGWFELRIEPVPEGLVILSIDVTERKRIEHQLLRSQRMDAMGRLAVGIAHDFNNLLGVVTGYGELMLQHVEEGHPARGGLEAIMRAAVKAAELNRQLVRFGRGEPVMPRVVDLNDVVRDIQRMLGPVIPGEIRLELRSEPRLWPVRVDPTQVEQVLVNLVVNARDAMPRGGRLLIETANVEKSATGLPARCVMLAVSDTGVGMDAATQGHIFEPFFTTKGEGKGTGLGLATIQRIVDQSHGAIEVESEPGRGSTFRVYFPALETPPRLGQNTR
jgi:two-component system cell cycle sensor histidine kinase/response regulator CckA